MRTRITHARSRAVVCARLILTVVFFQARLSSAQTTATGSDLQAVGDARVDPRSVDAQSIDVQTVFHLTNEDRAAQGLAPLRWSSELAVAANVHALQMAAAGDLSHQLANEADLTTRASQAGAHFSSVAENIAQGGRARQIEQQWMRSVPHRTNILDPRMNAIGIAVVSSGGTLYAVEDFANAVTVMTANEVEEKVEAELRGLAMHAAGGLPESATRLEIKSREEARQNCSVLDGILPGSQAGFVLRWEGPDLALPQPLVDAARSGRYMAASVGACGPSGGANRAFVVYRVTVLLY